LTDVAMALDLGGSALKFGLVSRAGEVVIHGKVRIDVAAKLAGVEAALRDAVARLREQARAVGVEPCCAGAGSAGTLFGPKGRLVTPSPNLPFMKDFELGAFIRRESGLNVVAENDATVAALAELRLGAGRGASNFLMATVGTGLGGGVVVHERLLRGRFGTAGEIGHAIFEPDGRACGCGSRGCLEQYCASRALKRFYREAGGGAVGVTELIERTKAGERAALRAVSRAARNLGIGLASFAALVPFDVIAIGGGVSVLGPLLLRPIREAFDAHALPYVRKTTRIVRARLGNRAGIVGAGLLAWDHAGAVRPRKRQQRAPS
jgi:glucokinase